MRLPPTRPARFLARPNRFVVEADLAGQRTRCFCANPGRLGELLVPGARLRVHAAAREGAATAHDAVLVRHGRTWVGLDTRMASPLFAEAVAAGRVAGLAGPLRAEVAVGGSRLDFATPEGFVEVKSASLVVDGEARWPDAPSERAARHCRVLAQQARRGRAATLAFLVQRPDADALAPNDATDPPFAAALRRAARAGVDLRAFTCATEPERMALAREVPVRL